MSTDLQEKLAAKARFDHAIAGDAFTRIRNLLPRLTDEQRLTLFDGYCVSVKGCGRPLAKGEGCSCENDE